MKYIKIIGSIIDDLLFTIGAIFFCIGGFMIHTIVGIYSVALAACVLGYIIGTATMLKEKERGIDHMENRKGDITIDTKKVH